VSKYDSTIYVGLDVHKESIYASVVPSNGTGEVVSWQTGTESKSIRRLVRKLRKVSSGQEIHAAYEAGPCGYALQRMLVSEGISCAVVAPSLIPVKPGERVKTDRKDARKLAENLRAGLLTEVHAPTEAQEAVRDLTRAREDAVEDRLRARHRLGKMLLRYGLVFRDGRNWTQRHHQWLAQQRFEEPTAQRVFELYLLAIEQASERLLRHTELLEELASQEPYAEQVGWLRCLRGVDTVTAMTILAELHDLRRFAHPRDLMSFLGLTPSESSSGERRRRGAITKAGNGHVRRVLVEAAWSYRHRPSVSPYMRRRRQGQPEAVLAIADRAQCHLHRKYFRMKEAYHKHHNVVMVAIARELVGYIWAILRHAQKA
jgi:transposase